MNTACKEDGVQKLRLLLFQKGDTQEYRSNYIDSVRSHYTNCWTGTYTYNSISTTWDSYNCKQFYVCSNGIATLSKQ